MGDKVVLDEMLSGSCDWEYTLKGVDSQVDWDVEVVSDSVGYEWNIENNNGVFELINKAVKSNQDAQKARNLIIVFSIVGGVLLVGVITAIAVLLRKKNKAQ